MTGATVTAGTAMAIPPFGKAKIILCSHAFL